MEGLLLHQHALIAAGNDHLMRFAFVSTATFGPGVAPRSILLSEVVAALYATNLPSPTAASARYLSQPGQPPVEKTYLNFGSAPSRTSAETR